MFDGGRVAGDIYQALRSLDYEVRLYNNDGNSVNEPVDARRFFTLPKRLLLSLIEDGENSELRLYISASIEPTEILNLIKQIRVIATTYGITSNVRKYQKEIEPRDFATWHSVTEGKKTMTQFYGTSFTSYLRDGSARMAIHHKAPLREGDSRTDRKNISSIVL
jgi:hypothetical protein